MASKTHVRLIGDVHGDVTRYLQSLYGATHTIQVGDMGFDYDFFTHNGVGLNHRFIGGNHDDYDKVGDCPNYLGDFGWQTIPDFGEYFFVRGAWSIDHALRNKVGPKKNFWEQEELTVREGCEAIELYRVKCPKLLISHGCPLSIVPYVTDPEFAKDFGYEQSNIKTKTAQLLEVMTEEHRPKMHVFGHYHCSFDEVIDGTRYVCVPIMGHLDLPKNFVDTL
jgi:hypothetical protein